MWCIIEKQITTIITHVRGSVALLLGDLAEIGLDVLESVQPDAVNPFPASAAPDQICAEPRKLCTEMSMGGG